MRETLKLRAGTGTDRARSTPGWMASAISVVNPTVYSVLVNVGRVDYPASVATADLWVPPNTCITYPVRAREFAFVLGLAGLAAPAISTAYPADVLISVLDPSEALPVYSSLPFGILAPSAVLLRTQPNLRPLGSYTDIVTLPAGIRSVVLRGIGSELDYITIQGQQSGQVYLSLVTPMGYAHHGSNAVPDAYALIDSELDSQISVNTSVIGATLNGYILVGYQERLARSVQQVDGRPMVDVVPPGTKALPVDADTGGLGAPLSVSGSTITPAALTPIVSTPALAAGTYRFGVTLGTTAPAAVGQAMVLSRFNAGGAAVQDYFFLPTPVAYYGRHYLTVLANETIRPRNWTVSGAGQVWSATMDWVKVA